MNNRELLVGVISEQAQLIEGLCCEIESLEARLKDALSDVTYLENRIVELREQYEAELAEANRVFKEARATLDKAVNQATAE